MHVLCPFRRLTSVFLNILISPRKNFNEGWDQERAWDDGTYSYGYEYDEGATLQSQEGGNLFEDHAPEVLELPRVGGRVSRSNTATTRISNTPLYQTKSKHGLRSFPSHTSSTGVGLFRASFGRFERLHANMPT